MKNFYSINGLVLFALIFFSNIIIANAQQPSFLSKPSNNSTCIPNSTILEAKDVAGVLYEWEFNTNASFSTPGIVVSTTQPTLVIGNQVTDFVKYNVRIRYKPSASAPFRNWGPVRGITFGNSSPSIKRIRIVAEEVRPQYSVTYEVVNNVGSIYTWSTIGGTINSGQGTFKITTDGKETNLSVTETNQCLRNIIVGNDSVVTRIRIPEGGATDLRTITTFNPIPVPGVTDSSKYTLQISKQSNFASLVYNVPCNSSDSAGGRWHPVWGTARLEYYTDYYARVKVKNGSFGDVFKVTTGGPRVFAINPAAGTEITSGLVYITLNTAVGAQDYFVEVDTDPAFNTSSLIQLTSKKNTFPATAVKFNKTYYIRARANVLQNGIAFTGIWDKVVSFTTIGAPITYLITPDDHATNIPKGTTLYCYKIQGASSYDWQLSTTSDFSSNVIQATKTVNYASFKSNLLDNKTYYVRVKANVASQNILGVWGPVYSFTTASAVRVGLFNDEEQNASAFFVAPNPFSDMLHINTSDEMQVLITNSLGKTLKEYKGDLSAINLGNGLEPGVYIVTMIDATGNKTVQKVVKF